MASTQYTKLPKRDPQTWVAFGERNIKWIIMHSLTLQTHVVCVQVCWHYESEFSAVSRCGLTWPYQCVSHPKGRRMCVGAKTHDMLPCPKHLSSMPQQCPEHVSSVFQTCPDHVPEHVCFSTRTLCLVGIGNKLASQFLNQLYVRIVCFLHTSALVHRWRQRGRLAWSVDAHAAYRLSCAGQARHRAIWDLVIETSSMCTPSLL